MIDMIDMMLCQFVFVLLSERVWVFDVAGGVVWCCVVWYGVVWRR